MASSPRKFWILSAITLLFGMLALGDISGTLGSITLGFGLNNNGTTITTFGNISINTSVIQTRMPIGMNTTASLVCQVNLLALTQQRQNFTYQDGILITNTSCV